MAPKCYISNLVDYTKKFGLGYILNNGMIGVYFNDGTKMIQKSEHTSDKKEVEYFFKKEHFD